MKRFFLALVLMSMVALSCKKQHATDIIDEPGNGQYKVTFNVGFSQQTADFRTNGLNVNSTSHSLATRALADEVAIFFYAVYKSDGSRFRLIQQVSTDSGFGTITDQLNAGTYTIVMAAGEADLKLSNDVINDRGYIEYIPTSSLNTDILSHVKPTLYQTYPFDKDAFFKKFTLTVPGTVSQNVNLDRITSRVKVIVEDKIPAGATTMQIAPQVAVKYYIGNGKASWGGYLTYNTALTPADIGTTNFTYSSPVFLPLLSNTTHFIQCKSSSAVISNYAVQNVICLPNTITVLTGNLFGGVGNPVTNGFHLLTDTSWNSTPINKPF